jgi:tetratricopeptide (TPR) repeat protein
MSRKNIFIIISIITICIVAFLPLKNLYHTYQINKAAKEFVKGSEFYYAKDFSKAKAHFQKAIELGTDPHATVLSYYFLGKIYNDEKNYDEAIKVLNKAIELAPNKKSPHYLLGIIYFKKGFLDKAKREFETALSISPQLIDAHYYLGLIYLKKKNKELALKEFKAELENGEHEKALEMIKKLKTIDK